MNTNAGAAKPVAPNLDQSDQGLGVGRGEGGESGGWCQVSNRPLFKTGTIEIISQNIKKIYIVQRKNIKAILS